MIKSNWQRTNADLDLELPAADGGTQFCADEVASLQGLPAASQATLSRKRARVMWEKGADVKMRYRGRAAHAQPEASTYAAGAAHSTMVTCGPRVVLLLQGHPRLDIVMRRKKVFECLVSPGLHLLQLLGLRTEKGRGRCREVGKRV
jgi:hypothetical protein